MIAIAIIAIGCVGAFVFWRQWIKAAARRLRNDPIKFHAWAVDSVATYRNAGVRVQPVIADYLTQAATKEWADQVGLAPNPVQLIVDAEAYGMPSLMRYQVSLSPLDKSYFEQAVTIHATK